MQDRRSKYSKQKTKTKNKINVNFDITELDLMCSYVCSNNKYIHRSNIINLRNLFNIMDMNSYNGDQERLSRIEFIKKGISARIDHNITNSDMIIRHITGGIGTGNSLDMDELDANEVQWINSAVSETLKYSNLYNSVDDGLALLTKFKATDYSDIGEVVKEIEDWVNQQQTKFRKAKADNSGDMTFSLSGNNYIQTMTEVRQQLLSPSNKLKFGTQALNILTGGGVECGRVYTILGLPGEGKSTTLLDMAIQIKRYNRNYICKDPTKKPCVVLLVMENSIKESVSRLFSMCVGKEIVDYNEDEFMDILKTKGNLNIGKDDPIDLIIKFKPYNSVDTSYLYTLTEDLEDEGYEVICFIQDYIKRIRSADDNNNKDERIKLGAVINEFKAFATIKDIPVITASQLNRTGTSVIDDARIKNKQDLVRLLGRSNVGESSLIIENSDWICIIAPEYDKDNCRYLGINRVKSRYRIDGLFCAYLPYMNGTIKFVEDINAPIAAHKESLREPVQLSNAPNTAQGSIEIKEFNDVKLKSDKESNIFVGASSILG